MDALSNYQLNTLIYESNNSLVYRGICLTDIPDKLSANSSVIIKILKQDYPNIKEITRYKQEYAIASQLNHLKTTINAYELIPYNRTFAIVFEDFGAISLKKWLDGKPLSLDRFLPIALEITKALDDLHRANIIHKDINPSNLVIHPDSQKIKLIDFGISTQLSRENPTFKHPNVLEGTLFYISPEQTGRINHYLDARTDFYSLGVTFYELLTGQVPFQSEDSLELIHCHLAKAPLPLSKIPQTLADIVTKLMAKNPEQRYQTTWGIMADLETCYHQFKESGTIKDFALGTQDISSNFRIPQRLYGRETEVQELIESFQRVNQPFNSKLELILVSGYSGIGKTALVQELYKPITEYKGYFISGKFAQFQGNIPYSAVINAFQDLVRQLLSEDEVKLQQWREKILLSLGTNAQVILDVIPDIELIIGQQQPVPELEGIEAQNRFNFVFQNFIRVFSSFDHPLVIFLDDLQWADFASLQFIKLIMLNPELENLLLIGSYRNNEVDSTHSLIRIVQDLQNSGARINQITLAPLSLNSLSQLIADTLHSDVESVKDLATLVSKKTAGNPFFVNQFLNLLYQENLIQFVPPQVSSYKEEIKGGYWQWNIEQIESKKITDNVVDLVIYQFKQLSSSSQDILKLAACVGDKFDLNTLSIICSQSPENLFKYLLEAVKIGLILPRSELDSQLLIQEYKFLHDRVQQAAYTLIDESQKQRTHLKIGRLLLANSNQEELEEKIFKIVDQINQGIKFIESEEEKVNLAKLNLLAGQKAVSSTAYQVALQYFITGISLLNENSWQNQYDLSLALYSEATETASLSGDCQQMEEFARVVIEYAQTTLDQVQIYYAKLQSARAQGNLKAAIEIAFSVLKLLGIDLPEKPNQIDVQKALEETNLLLAGREIEDLINLPEMTDPEKQAALLFLAGILPATYITAFEIFMIVVLTTIKLSILYGNSSWSGFGYVCYGITLCGELGDIETGYKLGKLAFNLAKFIKDKKAKIKAKSTFAFHIIHWQEHGKEALPILRETYQEALDNGEFEFASYSAFYWAEHAYLIGQELNLLEKEIGNYYQAVAKIKQKNAFNWIAIFLQAVLKLLGRCVNPIQLNGIVYYEEQALLQMMTTNDRLGLHLFYVNKLILNYLFGEFTEAVQNAVRAHSYLDGVTAMNINTAFHFYDSLAHLALYNEVSESEKITFLARIKANQEKLYQWSTHAPMNNLHKFHLVEAVLSQLTGKIVEAMDFYELSIKGAKENGYLQEEALAYELAAKFYLGRKMDKIAQTYLKEAHYSYGLWGATAKVEQLEKCYPQFLLSLRDNSAASSTLIPSSNSQSKTFLDLYSILKVSQALSSEIILDSLIEKMMKIILEAAGAQRGYLLFKQEEEWGITASAIILENGKNLIETYKFSPVINADDKPLSMAIFNYVIRTQDNVVLNEATKEGIFTQDPYIIKYQPKSILCTPLVHQGTLQAVVYLENNLTIGAFTPEHLKILQILSSQAAIALTNARLYTEIQKSKNFSENLIASMQDGLVVLNAEGVHQEVNRAFCDMTGFSREELIKTAPPFVYWSPEDYETIEKAFHAVLQGNLDPIELLFKRKNGERFPVLISPSILKNEQGEVTNYFAVVKEITEIKQAQEVVRAYNQILKFKIAERTKALKESEERFRHAFDDAAVGMALVSLDGRWLQVNCSLCEIVGYSEKELQRLTFQEITHPDDLETDLSYIHQMLKGEIRSYQMEKRYFHKKGHIVWVLLSVSLLKNEAGQPLYFIVQFQDITARKQAEASLLEVNRRWKSLIDNVQLIVVGLDQFGKVEYVNPFFLKITGYHQSEVIGKNWFSNFLPAAYQENTQIVFEEILEQNFHSYYQNAILTKFGEERFIAWNNTVLRDLQNNIIGTISIGEDITERYAVERIKSEFISIVSHELRTPLTAIRGSLGLLATGIYDKRSDKAKKMVNIALTDCERLVRLVNDILDLERLESKQVSLEKEACHINSLMEQAVEGVRAIAEQANITIVNKPISVQVLANPDAIIQVFTNLLSNALKFSPPQTTITLKAQQQPDEILFQVQDQGRGIPSDKLESIFGRFHQIDASDSRQKGGTGLGLAICKSLLEKHNGRIWAESVLGEGSTFYFTLPLNNSLEFENGNEENFNCG